MIVRYDRDADPGLITSRKVAVIGYGNQGHAHALNLRDAGADQLMIGARPGSASGERARAAGFAVGTDAEAAEWADLVMLLTPDEDQALQYREVLADRLRPGTALAFAHGLNVHFGLIEPRADLDIFLVAPKGPGTAVRAAYVAGGGLPALMAVAQDGTGHAHALALAYASAIGCGRAGIIETSFREECVTDLFGEQAVLCGGIPDLVMAGYDTLVEAGFEPEMAYFECVHEAKLIVDLMYARGIAGMREAISNTAEFGGYMTGARLITDETRAEMRRVLADIQDGSFARALVDDTRAGGPLMTAARKRQREHPVEQVGEKLRAMMPWISDKA